MAEAYIGEIRMTGFNFAPRGWALCNGQTLPINQNQALFSILGTTYGGNGQTTFMLPNLQCQIPIHFGQGPGLANYVQGQVGGEFNHTLTAAEMPQHTHTLEASSGTTSANLTVDPSNALPATSGEPGYATTANVTMAPQAVNSVGGGQSHPNLPPYLVINFIICLSGIFPSRN